MEPTPFSEQLRQAVAQSGLSQYRIAKRIEVSQATLSKFMAGKRGLSMEFTDRLFKLLGLSITGPDTGTTNEGD